MIAVDRDPCQSKIATRLPRSVPATHAPALGPALAWSCGVGSPAADRRQAFGNASVVGPRRRRRSPTTASSGR